MRSYKIDDLNQSIVFLRQPSVLVLNLETAVEREKGVPRACAYFRESTAVSRLKKVVAASYRIVRAQGAKPSYNCP